MSSTTPITVCAGCLACAGKGKRRREETGENQRPEAGDSDPEKLEAYAWTGKGERPREETEEKQKLEAYAWLKRCTPNQVMHIKDMGEISIFEDIFGEKKSKVPKRNDITPEQWDRILMLKFTYEWMSPDSYRRSSEKRSKRRKQVEA